MGAQEHCSTGSSRAAALPNGSSSWAACVSKPGQRYCYSGGTAEIKDFGCFRPAEPTAGSR